MRREESDCPLLLYFADLVNPGLTVICAWNVPRQKS